MRELGVRRSRWALLILAVVVGAVSLAARSQKVTLADADRLFAEKSYSDALKSYEALQAAGAVPAGRTDDVAYRIAVSMGKSQQWDQALIRSLDFVKTHRGTVWEPRGLYWLGRLLIAAPHQGYRIGATVHRGNDVPKQPSADAAPERIALGPQDERNAHDALEAARVLFGAFRSRADTRGEEVELDFDLARVLAETDDLSRWAMSHSWEKPDSPVWRIDTSQAYDPHWPAPKRIMYLYAQIPLLAESLKGGGHEAALALFGKALWLRMYHGMMQSYAVRYENGAAVGIPYPYENESPEAVLHDLVARYPADPVRDQAQYTVGLWLNQSGHYLDAERELKRLTVERPQSKWAVDARRDLEEITRRQLSLAPIGQAALGEKPKLQVGFRNLAAVRFRAYRVRLEDALEHARGRNVSERELNQFEGLFDNLDDLDRRYGRPAAEWTLDTKDTGAHEPRAETVTVPVSERGAYLVAAEGTSIRAGAVVLVTDLALVQQVQRDSALFFAADLRSGAPIAGSRVVAKQFWWEGGRQHSAFSEGDTDAKGLLTVPLLLPPGRSGFRVQAAVAKRGRYAITGGAYSAGYSDNT